LGIARLSAGGGPETSSGRRKLQRHAELDSASQGRGQIYQFLDINPHQEIHCFADYGSTEFLSSPDGEGKSLAAQPLSCPAAISFQPFTP